MTTHGKGRGFASMSPDQRREASRQGGLAVHEYGTGRQWTREQAQAAGVKGRESRDRCRDPWHVARNRR